MNFRVVSHIIPACPGRGTVILAAFPCTRPGEPDDAGEPGNPHALIASFARRHYYREAVARMKAVIRGLREPDSDVRLFSNSRLPEKPMAAAAGLGFYGRNGLIITPETGSRFIIAGMITPFLSTGASHPPYTAKPGQYCGECRLCVEACPTGALDGSGNLDRSTCLQALSTEYLLLPEPAASAWGRRLYGCDTCQDVCPFNSSPRRDRPPVTGELGPSLAVRDILSAGLKGELKTLLRGSALGMSWMDSRVFIRNALMTLTSADRPLRKLVQSYADGDDPVLSETARTVLTRISSGEAPGKGPDTIA